MNDDQRLLASAALDGAVTAEERARADADPEVIAEIERLRAVRAALQLEVAPDAERRDASIAAALAAFDEQPNVIAPPPPSLAAHRRTRWIAPLAAAAAVAVIAVGAVVALQGGGSDDDAASTPLNATVAGDREESGSTPELLAPEAADDGDVSSEAPAATEATEGTDRAAELETTAAATTTEIETLRTPDDLADFARRAGSFVQGEAGTDETCAIGTPLGMAYYVVGDTEVLVEVFEVAGEAVAVDPDGCDVVARAPSPESARQQAWRGSAADTEPTADRSLPGRDRPGD